MKKGLKDALAERFDALELDDQQYSDLERLVTSRSPDAESDIGQRNVSIGAWARGQKAIAAVLVASIALLSINTYLDYQSGSLLESIATEVANNHINIKPLEVESERLGEVLAYFSRLDFEPVDSPSIFGESGGTLLGGRYCSIQGFDAAQLHVVARDGNLNTLYQGMLPPEKLKSIPDVAAGESPALRMVKGVEVTIWQERGVIFARAKN